MQIHSQKRGEAEAISPFSEAGQEGRTADN
jgi:hypothetical protein